MSKVLILESIIFAKQELIIRRKLRVQRFATGKNVSFNRCHKQRVLLFLLGKAFFINVIDIFFLLCMPSLIQTLKGLGEFPIVMQNSLEFSQHPLVFISGYANRENVSYYLIFMPTTIRETTPTWMDGYYQTESKQKRHQNCWYRT